MWGALGLLRTKAGLWQSPGQQWNLESRLGGSQLLRVGFRRPGIW